MSIHNDGAAAVTGGSLATSPFWLHLLEPGLQVAVPLLGFFVLLLTLWNKWLEIKIKREILKDHREDE